MRIHYLGRVLFTACAAGAISASIATASVVAISHAGPRMALRLDPDQVVLGASAHLLSSDIGNDRLRLVGLGSVGLGEDTTVYDAGLDVQVVLTDSPLAPDTFFFVGAGTDLSVTRISSGIERDTKTRLGLMLSGGVERRLDARSSMFGEFRMHIHEPGEWFEVALGVNFVMPR